MDGPTDGPTDGQKNGQMGGRTNPLIEMLGASKNAGQVLKMVPVNPCLETQRRPN